jgi:hypothetical protein
MTDNSSILTLEDRLRALKDDPRRIPEFMWAAMLEEAEPDRGSLADPLTRTTVVGLSPDYVLSLNGTAFDRAHDIDDPVWVTVSRMAKKLTAKGLDGLAPDDWPKIVLTRSRDVDHEIMLSGEAGDVDARVADADNMSTAYAAKLAGLGTIPVIVRAASTLPLAWGASRWRPARIWPLGTSSALSYGVTPQPMFMDPWARLAEAEQAQLSTQYSLGPADLGSAEMGAPDIDERYLTARDDVYCDYNQIESPTHRLMVDLGHPGAAAYQEARHYFDTLRYASNAGARFAAWKDQFDNTQFWAPRLGVNPHAYQALDETRQERTGLYGAIYPSSPHFAQYLKALADSGWPRESVGKNDIDLGTFVIRTTDPAMKAALTQSGTPSAHVVSGGYWSVQPRSIEEFQLVRAMIEAFQADGALPPRTPAADLAATGQLPLSDKKWMLANVDEVTLADRHILVPLVPFGDRGNWHLNNANKVLELIQQGYPVSDQVVSYLQTLTGMGERAVRTAISTLIQQRPLDPQPIDLGPLLSASFSLAPIVPVFLSDSAMPAYLVTDLGIIRSDPVEASALAAAASRQPAAPEASEDQTNTKDVQRAGEAAGLLFGGVPQPPPPPRPQKDEPAI